MREAGYTLSDMIKFARNPKTGEHTKSIRDRIEMSGGKVYVRLHGHAIAIFDPHTSTLKISDCGYRTLTTKTRLNKILDGIGYITQKDFQWYITISGKKREWNGSMTISSVRG